MRPSPDRQRASFATTLRIASWATGLGAAIAFFAFLNLNHLLHSLWANDGGSLIVFAEVNSWNAFATACVCALSMACAARLVPLSVGPERVLTAAAGFCSACGVAALSWQLLGADAEELAEPVWQLLWTLGTAAAPLLLAAAGLQRASVPRWPMWLIAALLFASRAGMFFGASRYPDSEPEIVRSSFIILMVHASTAVVALLVGYSARRVRLGPRTSSAESLAADAFWLLTVLLFCRALLFIAPGPVSAFLQGTALSATWIREWFLRVDAAVDVSLVAPFALLAVAVARGGGRYRSALIAIALCVVAAVGEQLAAENQPVFVLDRLFDVQLSLRTELWITGLSDLVVLGLAPVFALYAVTQVWAREINEVPTNTVWWLLAGGLSGITRAIPPLQESTLLCSALALSIFAGLWRLRRVAPALDREIVSAPAAEAAPEARASPG